MLAAFLFAGLTFRPQIVGAGPLFPSIQSDLGVSHAAVGLLGTIPVLCMGLFAPPAALLVGRIGTRAGIALAVGITGVFGLLRVLAPGAVLLVVLTLGVGVGMGLGGAIVPVAIKEGFTARPGFATGFYTTGIQLGCALSSSLAIPIAHAFGGWRWSLGVFSATTCVLAVLCFALTSGEPPHRPHPELPPMPPLRRPSAWLLVGTFALMASTYYGMTNWLADSFVERGWSDGHAGWLIAVLNIASVPGAFLIPWLSDHVGGRRPWLIGTGVGYVVAAFGFVQMPGGAWLWAVIAGIVSGAMFPLVLTLPLDIEPDPRRVGALVGMMLGFGYVLGALSPLVLGAVRDATGSFTGSLWLIVGFTAALLASVAVAPIRQRAATAHSAT